MMMDSFCIIMGLVIANQLRPLLSQIPGVAPIEQPVDLPWYLYLVFIGIWGNILLATSTYDGRLNVHIIDEFTSLTVGSLLAGISLAGVLFFLYRDISRVLYATFWLTSFLLLLTWRSAARLLLRSPVGHLTDTRRVLIVGAGPLGRDLLKRIEGEYPSAIDFVGFLDDDTNKIRQHKDVLGTIDKVRKVVTDQDVQDVIVALPARAHQRLEKLVAELIDLPVKVFLIPDFYHLALHKAAMTEFAGFTLVDLRAPALNEYQRMVKRGFDLVVSLLCMIVALPLMGIVAFAIWVDDRGPVLFRQIRMGENGKPFKMLKFRTMVKNAEQLRSLVEKVDDQGNLIHKTPNDPRVTRVGRFLRRMSLDELPQLFNVLKGEMSIVGPRPELPYLVEKYQPWQRTRFAVPQGMTGWWQISGRSDRPMHLNTEDDIYYVQNYSLWLDIQILIKTLFMLMRGKGAY
jgi:exopolysaccharide biosynthesis polyprenyl glycosylphosphotransferase